MNKVRIIIDVLMLFVFAFTIQAINYKFDEFRLKIYDFLGRMVKNGTIYTGHNTIDLSVYHKGIYLLQIKKNGMIIGSREIVN